VSVTSNTLPIATLTERTCKSSATIRVPCKTK